MNVMVAPAALQINCEVRHGAGKPGGMRPWRDDGTEDAVLRTWLLRDTGRSIIARNDSPDLALERSINPYRGCEIGCVYCFARVTHAYLGLSPWVDFESKIVFKPEAARLLEKELSRPGYKAAPLVLGSNTDPYQPIERTLSITRALLEVLERFNHPVVIVTKSAMVLRDADILARMAAKGLAFLFVSVTTLNPVLARAMEPRAASPARRLEVMSALAAAGIPAGVLASPMIPGVNDAELEAILAAASKAGAGHAGSLMLRLPLELTDFFTEWLNRNMPERATEVLRMIRQRGGAGLNADGLARRFGRAAAAAGLSPAEPALQSRLFAVPAARPEMAQLALF